MVQIIDMLELVRNLLAAANQAAHAYPIAGALAKSVLFATVTFGTLGLIFLVLERKQNRDTSRYRSWHFLNDIAYTIVYQGGLYNVLLWAPLFALGSSRLEFLGIGVLERLPAAGSILVYWITVDFAAYWIHRLQHRFEILWAFHSIHHTQTRMTYLTSNRNHVLEQLYVNCVMIVPALILGMPARMWMPVYFAQVFFEHAQHAQVRWSYGPLHAWLVSPAFHAMHHSTRPDEYNGNYAKIFSVWDRLFGTFVPADREPAAYGVEGMEVQESLGSQFLHPFRFLRSRIVPAAGSVPEHNRLDSAGERP